MELILPRSTPLEAGRVLHMSLEDGRALDYRLYIPSSGACDAPILVSVHGISGNADEHARRFMSAAEEHGVVLIAPFFSPDRFADYQRLGRRAHSMRADLALKQAIRETADRTGARGDRVYMFGYSGGGQFVHRYAMAHPEDVAAYVVGAAGWYTFPDDGVGYPRGIRPGSRPEGTSFQPASFLRIPCAVLVGERDKNRESTALNKSRRITEQQGSTRFERGYRWIDAMRRAARGMGLDTRFEFRSLPRCPHSFRKTMKRSRMDRLLFEWLFD